MKTNPLPFSMLALAVLVFSAEAAEPVNPPPREADDAAPAPPQRESARGLQLASGLQTASLQTSASLAPRLTDEEWRQRFPLQLSKRK